MMPDNGDPSTSGLDHPGWRNRIIRYETVDPRELTPHPRNFRHHPPEQRSALGAVLADIGLVDPVIVNERSGYIVNGNLRHQLAIERGEAALPVIFVSLSDEDEAAVLATFDPISAMATVDHAQLQALLSDVVLSNDVIDAVLGDLLAAAPELSSYDATARVDESIPELPAASFVRPGDMFELGEHRILCGDSTTPDSFARLMDGAVADLLWTDPPYGSAYAGGSKARVPIAGDQSTEVAERALAVVAEFVAPGGAAYCCAPGGSDFLRFGSAFIDAGFKFASTLIWAKQAPTFGRSDYAWQHEPVIYGWRTGAPHKWHGDHSQSTVWRIDRPARSDLHPSMKPVELVARALRNSSTEGAIVVDPFVGIGPAFVAAEMGGRRCFGIELEPHYVEVTIDRWQALTGGKARRIEA